jgi:hypothetical protein
METTTFTALAERAGRWWTIRIPQIDGLTAQARTLDQVEIMSRQVIARHLGVPPESISVDVIPDAPAPVAQALQARAVARQAVEAAAMATRAALEALAAEGHTFPDASTMLGLTPSETEVFGQAAGATLSGNSGPLQVTGQ